MAVKTKKKPPTPEQSKLGRMKRSKGAGGEREAAKLWQEFYPHCKRMFPRQQQGVKYPDIGCPDMNKEWYVEVKRRKRITDSAAVKFWINADREHSRLMVMDATVCNAQIVLMFRENEKEWHVLINAHDRKAIGMGELPKEYAVGNSNKVIAPWSEFAEWLRNRTEVK